MNLEYKYRVLIFNVILVVFSFFWRPYEHLILDVKSTEFHSIAVLMLLVFLLELPATIIKSSALYHSDEFGHGILYDNSKGGLISWFFLLRFGFSAMLAFSLITRVLPDSSSVVLLVIVSGILVFKDIISMFISLNPIINFKPPEVLEWLADIILLAFSALFITLLEGEMHGNSGEVMLSLNKSLEIILTLAIFGFILMSVYYGTRILFYLQEQSSIETKSDKFFSWFSYALVLGFIVYPMFRF